MPRSGAAAGLVLVVLFACACSTGNGPDTESPADGTAASGPESPPDGHSSRDSLDWAGTYSGITPCADCPGIRTTVSLNADGSYRRTLVYLERSVAPLVDSGRFSWDAAGAVVSLDNPDGQQYQVGENALFQLDRDGNRITGDLAGRYVLGKHVRDPALEDRRWTLIELRGVSVDAGSASGTPYLVFDAEDRVVSGAGSCNTFSGGYAIVYGNRIRFDEDLAMTLRACPDMTVENEFFDMLHRVDNYAVADGMLSLNRARMAPLARFREAGD